MGAVQLSMLDESIGVPAARDVLYFAIQPDAATAERIAGVTASLVKRHGLRGRPRPLDTLHVTVLGIGFAEEVSSDQLAIAAEAARTVVFRPFPLVLGEALSFRRQDRAPLVLRCGEGREGVNDLAHALFDRMARSGFVARGTTHGEPHLTLLYDNVLVPPTPLAWPIHLDVTGFSLVRNHWGIGRYDCQHFDFAS